MFYIITLNKRDLNVKVIFNKSIAISIIFSIIMAISVSVQKSCKCCDANSRNSIVKQCCSGIESSHNTEKKPSCCSKKGMSNKECQDKCNCNSLCSSRDQNNTAKIENSEISFDYLQKFLSLIFSLKIIAVQNNLEYSLVLTNEQNFLKLPLIVPLRV